MMYSKVPQTMIIAGFICLLVYLPIINGENHGIGNSQIRSDATPKSKKKSIDARHQAILNDLSDMLNPVFRDLRKLNSVGPRKTCINPITGDVIVFDECVESSTARSSKGTKVPGKGKSTKAPGSESDKSTKTPGSESDKSTKAPGTGKGGTKAPGSGKGNTKSPGKGSASHKQTCAPTPEPSVSFSPSSSPTTTQNPTESQEPTFSQSPTLSLTPSSSPSRNTARPSSIPTLSQAPSSKSAKQKSSSIRKSTKAPSATQKSASSKSESSPQPSISSNTGPPVCTAEDLNDPAVDALLDFCTSLALGEAEPTTLRGEFEISLTLFSVDTADTDLFQEFLQFIVAPLAAGCDVNINDALSSLTATSRRLLDADDSDIKSVDVGEVLILGWGAGASMCSETPPNDSDYCTDGRVLITATGKDEDALEKYRDEFRQELETQLQKDEVLAALGLTGATMTDVKSVSVTDDSDSGSVSAVTDSDQPIGRQLRIGFIFLGVLVGLALCALLAVCANRIFKRSRSHRRYNQPLKVDYEDDDFTKLIDDRSTNRSESLASFDQSQRDRYSPRQPPSNDFMETRKPPVPREVRHEEEDLFSIMTPATAKSSPRMAHILGEENSIFTGNSWQGSRDRQLPPVYQAPVDAEGFPASIHTTSENGSVGIFDSTYQHPPHVTCSSPNCQICEKKRQQSNIRFIKVGDPTPISPRPNRFGPKRDYVIADTCDL